MDARSRHGDHEVLLDSDARANARERERTELRRERDVVVVALARDLGEPALAEQMGVAQSVVAKLVADARDRLSAGDQPAGAAIVARRLGASGGRWGNIDAHYEALGSGAIAARRYGGGTRQ